MAERSDSGATTPKNPTTAERTSDRELVVKRTINGPARLVFEAWTRPELFQRWWVPESFGLTLLSCEMDVRVGVVGHEKARINGEVHDLVLGRLRAAARLA